MSEIQCGSCNTKVQKDKWSVNMRFEGGYDADGGPADLNNLATVGPNLLAYTQRAVPVCPSPEKLGVQVMLPVAQVQVFLCRELVEYDGPTEFAGTADEALEAGWTEEELGWVCPTCNTPAGEDDLGAYSTEGSTLKAGDATIGEVEEIEGASTDLPMFPQGAGG